MELTELEITVAAISRKMAALRWRQAHGENVEADLNTADAELGATYSEFAAAHSGNLTPGRLGHGERKLQIHLRAALR